MSTELHITCPVLDNSNGTNNRDAQWRFLLESESGAECQFAQFACGMWAVAPAVVGEGVRVLSLTGSGRPGQTDLISLHANPIPHNSDVLPVGGSTWHFGPGEVRNSAANLMNSLPVLITPPVGSCVSLMACMQRNVPETSVSGTSSIHNRNADAFCFVTVMPSIPANISEMIRPNAFGDVKEFLTWNDFDLTRLPSHAWLGSRTFAVLNNERIRWSHSTEVFSMINGSGTLTEREWFRAFRSQILVDDYAAGRAVQIVQACLYMAGTNTLAEKKPALAAIIAHGLDQWHYVYGTSVFPGQWTSGAGQWLGQLTAPALAAGLLIDETKAHKLRKVSALTYCQGNASLKGPQEMRQIFPSLSGVPIWGDDVSNTQGSTTVITTQARYHWNEVAWSKCYDGALETCKLYLPGGLPGNKTRSDPHRMIDGPPGHPGHSYAHIAGGGFRGLAAVMLAIPRVRWVVNNDLTIQWAHRIKAFGVWTMPDTAAPPSPTESSACSPFNVTPTNSAGCTEYRITWGPTLADIRFPCPGSGRFPSLHGTNHGLQFTNGTAEANWSTLMALYDGPTYVETQVPLTKCVAPQVFTYIEDSVQYAAFQCSTWDAVIHYEMGADEASTPDPTPASPAAATNPILAVPMGANLYVKAIAVKAGLTTSNISSSAGTIVAPPEPEDTTPPTFTTAPEVTDITQTTANLRVTCNESGLLYWMQLADNATAPISTAVKAGGGLASGSMSVAAGLLAIVPITDGTAGVARDLHIVAEDAAGNLQASPTKLDITFAASPPPAPPEPVVSGPGRRGGKRAVAALL